MLICCRKMKKILYHIFRYNMEKIRRSVRILCGIIFLTCGVEMFETNIHFFMVGYIKKKT